jgi:hypothetical protein
MLYISRRSLTWWAVDFRQTLNVELGHANYLKAYAHLIRQGVAYVQYRRVTSIGK